MQDMAYLGQISHRPYSQNTDLYAYIGAYMYQSCDVMCPLPLSVALHIMNVVIISTNVRTLQTDVMLVA